MNTQPRIVDLVRMTVLALTAIFFFTGLSIEIAAAATPQTPGAKVTISQRSVRRQRRRRAAQRRQNTPPAVSTNVNVIPPATSRNRVGTSNNEVLTPVGPRPTGLKNVVSGGVLNGKALVLPKPVYPATARAAHVSGSVNVQVTVDEEGKVIAATAVSGPVLLRAAAVMAARGAKFSPTVLSGWPVKVIGNLIYNFSAPITPKVEPPPPDPVGPVAATHHAASAYGEKTWEPLITFGV